MRQRDLTVILGVLKPHQFVNCLLTGRPGSVTRVTLRRMTVIPPIWFGWKVEVVLPLEKPQSLAVWQYLRMLRPYLLILVVFVPAGLLKTAFVSALGEVVGGIFSLGVLASAVAVWFVIGWALDRFEFVRLLSYNNMYGTAKLRFNSPELARRARDVLILAEEREKFAIRLPQKNPQPPVRRTIRYLAGFTALACIAIGAAVFLWSGDPDAWIGSLVLLVIGICLGGIAVGRTGVGT